MLYHLCLTLYRTTFGVVTIRFRLRALIDKAGMSQSELSRRSGVSFATINRMCTNATATVALETLDRLATALGVEPGELFERPRKAGGEPRMDGTRDPQPPPGQQPETPSSPGFKSRVWDRILTEAGKSLRADRLVREAYRRQRLENPDKPGSADDRRRQPSPAQ